MHARSFLMLAGLFAGACAPAIPARPQIAPVSQSIAVVDTPATAVRAPMIPDVDLSNVNLELRLIGQPR